MTLNDVPTTGKYAVDAISIGAMVGSLTDFLPHLAAIFTIVWTGIRIWETDTVQMIFGRKDPKDLK